MLQHIVSTAAQKLSRADAIFELEKLNTTDVYQFRDTGTVEIEDFNLFDYSSMKSK